MKPFQSSRLFAGATIYNNSSNANNQPINENNDRIYTDFLTNGFKQLNDYKYKNLSFDDKKNGSILNAIIENDNLSESEILLLFKKYVELNGLKINTINSKKENVLHIACKKKYFQVIDYLLNRDDKKLLINQYNEVGNLPVHDLFYELTYECENEDLYKKENYKENIERKIDVSEVNETKILVTSLEEYLNETKKENEKNDALKFLNEMVALNKDYDFYNFKEIEENYKNQIKKTKEEYDLNLIKKKIINEQKKDEIKQPKISETNDSKYYYNINKIKSDTRKKYLEKYLTFKIEKDNKINDLFDNLDNAYEEEKNKKKREAEKEEESDETEEKEEKEKKEEDKEEEKEKKEEAFKKTVLKNEIEKYKQNELYNIKVVIDEKFNKQINKYKENKKNIETEMDTFKSKYFTKPYELILHFKKYYDTLDMQFIKKLDEGNINILKIMDDIEKCEGDFGSYENFLKYDYLPLYEKASKILKIFSYENINLINKEFQLCDDYYYLKYYVVYANNTDEVSELIRKLCDFDVDDLCNEMCEIIPEYRVLRELIENLNEINEDKLSDDIICSDINRLLMYNLNCINEDELVNNIREPDKISENNNFKIFKELEPDKNYIEKIEKKLKLKLKKIDVNKICWLIENNEKYEPKEIKELAFNVYNIDENELVNLIENPKYLDLYQNVVNINPFVIYRDILYEQCNIEKITIPKEVEINITDDAYKSNILDAITELFLILMDDDEKFENFNALDIVKKFEFILNTEFKDQYHAINTSKNHNFNLYFNNIFCNMHQNEKCDYDAFIKECINHNLKNIINKFNSKKNLLYKLKKEQKENCLNNQSYNYEIISYLNNYFILDNIPNDTSYWRVFKKKNKEFNNNYLNEISNKDEIKSKYENNGLKYIDKQKILKFYKNNSGNKENLKCYNNINNAFMKNYFKLDVCERMHQSSSSILVDNDIYIKYLQLKSKINETIFVINDHSIFINKKNDIFINEKNENKNITFYKNFDKSYLFYEKSTIDEIETIFDYNENNIKSIKYVDNDNRNLFKEDKKIYELPFLKHKYINHAFSNVFYKMTTPQNIYFIFSKFYDLWYNFKNNSAIQNVTADDPENDTYNNNMEIELKHLNDQLLDTFPKQYTQIIFAINDLLYAYTDYEFILNRNILDKIKNTIEDIKTPISDFFGSSDLKMFEFNDFKKDFEKLFNLLNTQIINILELYKINDEFMSYNFLNGDDYNTNKIYKKNMIEIIKDNNFSELYKLYSKNIKNETKFDDDSKIKNNYKFIYDYINLFSLKKDYPFAPHDDSQIHNFFKKTLNNSNKPIQITNIELVLKFKILDYIATINTQELKDKFKKLNNDIEKANEILFTYQRIYDAFVVYFEIMIYKYKNNFINNLLKDKLKDKSTEEKKEDADEFEETYNNLIIDILKKTEKNYKYLTNNISTENRLIENNCFDNNDKNILEKIFEKVNLDGKTEKEKFNILNILIDQLNIDVIKLLNNKQQIIKNINENDIKHPKNYIKAKLKLITDKYNYEFMENEFISKIANIKKEVNQQKEKYIYINKNNKYDGDDFIKLYFKFFYLFIEKLKVPNDEINFNEENYSHKINDELLKQIIINIDCIYQYFDFDKTIDDRHNELNYFVLKKLIKKNIINIFVNDMKNFINRILDKNKNSNKNNSDSDSDSDNGNANYVGYEIEQTSEDKNKIFDNSIKDSFIESYFALVLVKLNKYSNDINVDDNFNVIIDNILSKIGLEQKTNQNNKQFLIDTINLYKTLICDFCVYFDEKIKILLEDIISFEKLTKIQEILQIQ